MRKVVDLFIGDEFVYVEIDKRQYAVCLFDSFQADHPALAAILAGEVKVRP